MTEHLTKVWQSIRAGDEVILSSFGIDERIISEQLKGYAGRIKRLRLVYQAGYLKSPGFLDISLPGLEIVRTPVVIESDGCPIFHSKLIVLATKGGIRRLAVPSFNFTTYHFSDTRSVVDSMVVLEGAHVEGVNRLLKLQEFSQLKDRELVRRGPALLLFKQVDHHRFKFSYFKDGITEAIRSQVPRSVRLIAGPHIGTGGLKLLGLDPKGLELRGASANDLMKRLHGKFLVGQAEDGKMVVWFGSLNFTENAIGGHNHEALVCVNQTTRVKTLINQLRRFELWSEKSQQGEYNPEEEPNELPVRKFNSALSAKLMFNSQQSGRLALELRFLGCHEGVTRVALAYKDQSVELIENGKLQTGKNIVLQLQTEDGFIPDLIRDALRAMIFQGYGNVRVNIGHEALTYDLDLGPLWRLCTETLPENERKGKNKRQRAGKQKGTGTAYLTGRDVRPLRVVLRNGKLRELDLFTTILNGSPLEGSEWVVDWTADPWVGAK